MKPTEFWALAVPLLAFVATPAAAAQVAVPQVTSPPGAVAALRSYAPARNPGGTDFDVADRAAIANLIYAYSFAYDNGEADAWLALFAPDAMFVAGMPGEKPVSFQGAEFRAFWTKRMNAFRASGNVRRHLMSNILFLDQTGDTAHVSVVGLLTNAKDHRAFTAVSSLNYEGWLAKGPDGWKIQRWHDFPDAAFQE